MAARHIFPWKIRSTLKRLRPLTRPSRSPWHCWELGWPGSAWLAVAVGSEQRIVGSPKSHRLERAQLLGIKTAAEQAAVLMLVQWAPLRLDIGDTPAYEPTRCP